MAVQAADWPQWRGIHRDGITEESAAGTPKLLWKINVGTGCSSFAVVGDRVFTMGNLKDTDTVHCLDGKTGKTVWQHSYPAPLGAKLFEGGPTATPTVDENTVFTMSRTGLLLSLNKETGKVLWSKDLAAEFGAKPPSWGYSGSPLVEGEKLIVDVGAKGASVVAFDKATGKVIWQAGDDAASYGSPYAFTRDGKRCLAFFEATGLVVRGASDGKELLRYPWKTSWDVNPTTAIVSNDKIFIASGYGHGGVLLPLNSASPTPLWETKNMKNKMNSCVLWKGNLYGFDESTLTCLDFATGSVKWQQKGLGIASLIIADGKLVVMSETGDLVIAEASPDAYKELNRTPAVGGKSWVIPVLANGRIYCRNNSGEVAGLELVGK